MAVARRRRTGGGHGGGHHAARPRAFWRRAPRRRRVANPVRFRAAVFTAIAPLPGVAAQTSARSGTPRLLGNVRNAMNSCRAAAAGERPPAQQSRGARAARRRSLRSQAGTVAAAEAGGGNTVTADMDGLVRCSGRSPITTSMITRSGATASVSGLRLPRHLRRIFAPYGYNDLSGYLPQRPSGRRHGRPAPLAQMCGDDSRNIAGLPIDQIQLAVRPTEAQFAALDELGNASIRPRRTFARRVRRRSC